MQFVIFQGAGRLGNQLFQYNALKYLFYQRYFARQKKYFIILNMHELINCLEIDFPYFHLAGKWVNSFMKNVGERLLNLVGKLRFISVLKIVKEDYHGFLVERDFNFKKGIYPLIWVPVLYLQRSCLVQDKSHFRLKQIYIQKAMGLYRSLPKDKEVVFVHLRRGDYATFPVLGKVGTILPKEYYLKAITRIEVFLKNPFYVFLTDDPEYVSREFFDIKNKIISSCDHYTDLAFMTLCRYGIVSNSSFAWWGAYLMKERKKVIAPRYWLGFKRMVEYPPGIIANFFEILDPI